MSNRDKAQEVIETAVRQLSQEGFAKFSTTVFDICMERMSREEISRIKENLQVLAFKYPKVEKA